MEPSFELPFVPHFDIDPLVQTQSYKVKRFLNSRIGIVGSLKIVHCCIMIYYNMIDGKGGKKK